MEIQTFMIDQQDIEAIKRRFKEVYIKDNNDIFLNTLLDLSILNK